MIYVFEKSVCSVCEHTLTIEGAGSNKRGIGPLGTERSKAVN